MTIGEKLHELRIAKGIPAAALDELGERVLRTRPELLEEIAKYFDVNIRELTGCQDEPV